MAAVSKRRYVREMVKGEKEGGVTSVLFRRPHIPITNVGTRNNLFGEVVSVICTSSSKREKRTIQSTRTTSNAQTRGL